MCDCGGTCSDCVRGNKGDNGTSSIEYRAYASDNAGTGFSLIPSSTLKWTQSIIRDTPVGTLTVADFPGTWVKYIGDDGAAGADAANSGAEYIFSSSTTNADPGATFAKFDNANLTLATKLYISETNANSLVVAAYLAMAATSTNTVKALVKISSKADATKFAIYAVTALTDNGGWDTLDITYKVASSATPFAASDHLIVTISVSGDKGLATQTSVILHNDLSQPMSTGVGDNIIASYNIPANTLVNNGDSVYIEAVVINTNPFVPGADAESSYMKVDGHSNILHHFSNNVFPTIYRINIDRIDATHYLLTFNQDDIEIRPLLSFVVAGANFAATLAIEVHGVDTIVSVATTFIVCRKLFVQYTHA